jgi:hypothetical protein
VKQSAGIHFRLLLLAAAPGSGRKKRLSSPDPMVLYRALPGKERGATRYAAGEEFMAGFRAISEIMEAAGGTPPRKGLGLAPYAS